MKNSLQCAVSKKLERYLYKKKSWILDIAVGEGIINHTQIKYEV